MNHRAIELLNEQQSKVKERSAPWMVAEQLKDICRREPESAELLAKDLENLQAKRDAVKAKVAVAKTQEKMNKMGSSISGAGEAMAAFDRMEEKANRMLDEANAMSQLNARGDSIEDLAKKYDMDESSSSVDDELAALKAKMGL